LVEEDPKLQEVISKLEEVYKGSERLRQPLRKEGVSKEDKVVYIQAFVKKSEEDEEK
jgi:F0F1-type ATP synthase delta subunit